MAMVKISNGEVTQVVSRGAFESQYKNLGFNIVCDNSTVKTESKPVETNKPVSNPTPVVNNEVEEDNSEEADDFEELLEKPLSQWSNEELKAFVNTNDIDTSSAKKTSEVRALVKSFLDEQAKNSTQS